MKLLHRIVIVASLAALAGCASNEQGTSPPPTTQVSTVKTILNARHASTGKQALYVFQTTSTKDMQVVVFGDSGNKYLRTVDLGNPPTQALAFGVGLDGLLYTAAGQNGRPATLNIYSNNGAKLLRSMHQGHPFVGAEFDSANNLYTACNGQSSCERANGKSKVTRLFRGGGFTIATDASNDVAMNSAPGIWVFAPGATQPYWSINDFFDRLDALAFDSKGNLYVCLHGEHDNGSIRMYPPNATTPSETITDGILNPAWIAIDRSDNLYVLNQRNVTVYAPGTTSPGRTISDGISGGNWGRYDGFGPQMTFDRAGNLYVANSGGSVTVYALGGTSPIRTITQGISSAMAVSLSP